MPSALRTELIAWYERPAGIAPASSSRFPTAKRVLPAEARRSTSGGAANRRRERRGSRQVAEKKNPAAAGSGICTSQAG